jgi:sugar O-acyltransferase (sialic acid O-acetyltransferase NeuD family)
MTELVVFGCGGMGRKVVEAVRDVNESDCRSRFCNDSFEILGFIDEDVTKVGSTISGLPVLGTPTWLADHPSISVVIGIGSPRAKHNVVKHLQQYDLNYPPIIHPSALISRGSRIGAGCVVFERCILSCDLTIAEFVTVNIASTITHDDVIDSYATLSPACNLSGNVHVGLGAELGTRSVVLPGLHIGDWAVIGAGAVVNRSIPDHATAVGMPARVIKRDADGSGVPDA